MKMLAAIPSDGTEVLRRAMGSAVDLLPAVTMQEALAVARQGVDVIVCGIHFDDSRMFELLRTIKADSDLRRVPFICVRLVGSNLAPTLVQSLEISCELLGAADFIDLYSLERTHGPQQAEAVLSRLILAAAGKSAGSH
jgi:CheY-like chemotaxis protein